MRAGLFGGDWQDYRNDLQDRVEKAFWDSPDKGKFGPSDVAAVVANSGQGAPGPMGIAQSTAGQSPSPALQPQDATAATPDGDLTGFSGFHDSPIGVQMISPPNTGEPQSSTNGRAAAHTMSNNDILTGILGKIWDLPNTALGLGLGAVDSLATLATGQVPHLGFGNGALQISNLVDLSPLRLGGAITFGDTQLYNGVKPDQIESHSPYSGLSGFTYGDHEGGHTAVDDGLGIFALPLYLSSALVNGWKSNPYEIQADRHAKFGESPFP